MSNFFQFIKLSNKLHEFIASGECNSQKADDIRDELDYYWVRLTPEEIEVALENSRVANLINYSDIRDTLVKVLDFTESIFNDNVRMDYMNHGYHKMFVNRDENGIQVVITIDLDEPWDRINELKRQWDEGITKIIEHNFFLLFVDKV